MSFFVTRPPVSSYFNTLLLNLVLTAALLLAFSGIIRISVMHLSVFPIYVLQLKLHKG